MALVMLFHTDIMHIYVYIYYYTFMLQLHTLCLNMFTVISSTSTVMINVQSL